mgnify:CR=1 FL=1
MESNNNVVYFDGICGLCNSFIGFLVRIDQKYNEQIHRAHGLLISKYPSQNLVMRFLVNHSFLLLQI